MTSEHTARLRAVPATVEDPAARLLANLPSEWRGEVVGPGITGWESIVEGGRDRALRLHGLPRRLRYEAHGWHAGSISTA